jgi:hypothetical protein
VFVTDAEIVTALLNLAEFMEHDDKRLPLDTRTLGALAEKCHAFAKVGGMTARTIPETCRGVHAATADWQEPLLFATRYNVECTAIVLHWFCCVGLVSGDNCLQHDRTRLLPCLVFDKCV